ncbi:MAG TPA: response regulator [Candidatus Limnocylindria bacterium]|nr:response regulator [Candidatus Limnocylindria bacterium]
MNVELFVAALETDGHEVVVEYDGARAYARALAEPFDLLILDVQMPGMTGDAVCRALRKAGVVRPILAASALAMPEQIEHALAAGFDEYLTKPLSPLALRDAVRRHAPSAA